MFDTISQDVRHAFRMLRKNPGFSAIAVLSIAIGVGANAAMFSVADGLLLRPLAVPDAGDILVIGVRTPTGQLRNRGISYPDYRDLRDRMTAFDGLAAYRTIVVSYAPRREDVAQGKYGYAVSGNFFEMLRLRAAIGRTFAADEGRVVGGHPVVVLAHDAWARDFDADPNVINQTLRLARQEFTIIGVLPESFHGLDPYVPPAYYVPIATVPVLGVAGGTAAALEDRADRPFRAVGRLRSGSSLAQANAAVAAIGAQLATEHAATNRGYGYVARTYLAGRMAEYQPAAVLAVLLLILSIAVLFVACANLSGLLTSRAPARAREVAVRLSIGGNRLRIVRQMLIESLVIAAAGVVAGMGLAVAGVRVFQQFQFVSDVGIRLTYALDLRALVVGVVVAVVTALAASLVPAWRATGVGDLASTLRGATSGAGRRGRSWGRQGLVAAQVALSLVVVTLAVSFNHAFQGQLAAGPGFRTTQLAILNLDATLAGYSDARANAFFAALRDRVGAIPGVISATLTSFPPLSQDAAGLGTIAPEGRSLPAGVTQVEVTLGRVDERYLATVGIPLRRGRDFVTTDSAASPRVAIVNAHLAAHYWPGENVIGRRLRLGADVSQWVEIVGVAADSSYRLPGETPRDFLYVPLSQNPVPRLTVLAATSGDSAAISSQLRTVVTSLDPDMPIGSVHTMEDFYAASTSYQRVIVKIVSGLGVMGLTLALVGLYGLVAYSVSQRTREIGVRMAVGATPGAVLRLMMRQGIGPAGAGAVFGVLLSAAAGSALVVVYPSTGRTILPAALAIIPLLFAIVLVAAYVPSRRASRIDPLRALRTE